MPEPDVWIAVRDDGSVEAFDTQDAATNAVRDDENPWIELVQIQRAPKLDELGSRRRTWISAPQLTIPARWDDGGDAA